MGGAQLQSVLPRQVPDQRRTRSHGLRNGSGDRRAFRKRRHLPRHYGRRVVQYELQRTDDCRKTSRSSRRRGSQQQFARYDTQVADGTSRTPFGSEFALSQRRLRRTCTINGRTRSYGRRGRRRRNGNRPRTSRHSAFGDRFQNPDKHGNIIRINTSLQVNYGKR